MLAAIWHIYGPSLVVAKVIRPGIPSQFSYRVPVSSSFSQSSSSSSLCSAASVSSTCSPRRHIIPPGLTETLFRNVAKLVKLTMRSALGLDERYKEKMLWMGK